MSKKGSHSQPGPTSLPKLGDGVPVRVPETDGDGVENAVGVGVPVAKAVGEAVPVSVAD
jgi:hypothetical protein